MNCFLSHHGYCIFSNTNNLVCSRKIHLVYKSYCILTLVLECIIPLFLSRLTISAPVIFICVI